MDIEVRPLTIDVESDDDIPIYQGTSSITLTPKHLGVTTNGDPSKLKYLIVKKARYGRFTKNSTPIISFSQQDLEQRKVQYIQNPDSQGTDIFEIIIKLSYINVSRSGISYFIRQKPLVKQGPLVAVDSSYVAITRASLDASELAQLTNDDPHFRIAEGPNYGKIMMRRRQRREAGAESSFTPVSEFTFQDIIYTRIYYVPDGKVTKASQDKITYALSARGVPAAYGELIIDLDEDKSVADGSTTQIDVTGSKSNNNEEKNGVNGEKNGFNEEKEKLDGGKNDERSAEDTNIDHENFPNGTKKDNESSQQKPSMDSNIEGETSGDNITLIIIVLVLVLCLVLVAALVVVLVLRKRRAQERSKKNFKPTAKPRPLISGPLQLEQPHVLIQTKTGGMVSGIANQDRNTSAPLISSPVDSHTAEHIALVSSSSMSGEGKSAPRADGLYVNTAHVKDHTQNNIASPDVTQVTDGSRTRPESESAVSEDTGEQGSIVTSGRGSSATSDLIDWSLMDPDLLQSCNLSTPALRSNQYWL